MPFSTAINAFGSHVETATVLGTWTVQPEIDCLSAEAGAGQIVGSATFRVLTGLGRDPGDFGASITLDAFTALQGQYVRVSYFDGSVWVPIWHGTIDGYDLADNGAKDGGQILHATGLASGLLGNVYHSKGWMLNFAGSPGEVPYAPAYNDRASGGRSVGTHTIGGATAFVHQLIGGEQWTAANILGSILPRLAGVSLIQDGSLDYIVDRKEYDGWSLLDIVNDLANARRGITWVLLILGSTPIVYAYSIVPSSITVGSYTLPASSQATTINLSTSVDYQDVVLSRSDLRVYDEIRVYGARPWVGITVAYEDSPDEALGVGWTGASQTQENADQWWRRFEVFGEWDGKQFLASGGVRKVLTVVSNEYTGARTHGIASVGDPRAAYLLTGETPAGEGWTTNKDGPRQRAQAWLFNGSTYIDATGAQSQAGLGLAMDVQENAPCAIVLGSSASDATTVKANVDVSGGRVVATVGLREPAPLLVSWYRPGATPRDRRRTLEIRLPDAEQWVMLAGTFRTVSGATPATYANNTTIRDDLPRLQAALALAEAYYSSPDNGLSWSQMGISVATQPGTLITTATLSHGATAINGVVSRIRWDFRSNKTSWTCARVIPEIEAIR